jgi:hypothetical protein
LANKQQYNKDKEKNKRKAFKELEELIEKPDYSKNPNKETTEIYPIDFDGKKDLNKSTTKK